MEWGFPWFAASKCFSHDAPLDARSVQAPDAYSWASFAFSFDLQKPRFFLR